MTNLIIKLPTWTVNKTDLSEIANKMQAIELNLTSLFKDLKLDHKLLGFGSNIEADLSDQYDEFYVVDEDDKDNVLCHIEVVTREVATSNDKELLKMSGSKYTLQEIENDYEVGGTLSDYKKLGDSIYYYKEM